MGRATADRPAAPLPGFGPQGQAGLLGQRAGGSVPQLIQGFLQAPAPLCKSGQAEVGSRVVAVIAQDAAEMAVGLVQASLQEQHFSQAQTRRGVVPAAVGRALQQGDGRIPVSQDEGNSLQVGPARVVGVEPLGLGETGVGLHAEVVRAQHHAKAAPGGGGSRRCAYFGACRINGLDDRRIDAGDVHLGRRGSAP